MEKLNVPLSGGEKSSVKSDTVTQWFMSVDPLYKC